MARMIGSKAQGFTLIELIIVIVIVSILAGVGAQFLKLGFLAYYQGQNLIDADSQARVALSRLTNDLHNLRSTSDITTATANSLIFTDLYGNVISYQVSGSQLQRNNLALANNVQSITFQYYDGAGALLASPVTAANRVLIQYIKLTLIINTFNYTSGVTLWNTI
jgi:prepilin-type N-terminal cleavage/methylation domain-containing protein